MSPCVSDARIDGEDGHAGPVEAVREVERPREVEELRAAIRRQRVIRALRLEIVKRGLCIVDDAGSHVDDSGGRARVQRGEEELGQEKGRQVADSERLLDPVDGRPPLRGDNGGVVHENVHALEALRDFSGKSAYLGLRREIRREEDDALVPRPLAQFGGRSGARSSSRPTMITLAPSPARPPAVSFPIPRVPPVTRTVFAVIASPIAASAATARPRPARRRRALR